MLRISQAQEQAIQRLFYQNYVAEFSTFLKENYPQTLALSEEERLRMIHQFHLTTKEFEFDDYNRINTYIICCFLFGEESLVTDRKIMGLFLTANYETEGMINYLSQRLKSYKYA